MSTVHMVLDELLEPLGDCLTVEVAERSSALRAPTSVQARIGELARKSQDGQLDDSEREGYEALVSGNFIAILQSQPALTTSKGRRTMTRSQLRSKVHHPARLA